MDAEQRRKKVEGLIAIRDKGVEMAKGGAPADEVRSFITEGKKELAFEVPDEDSFKKAVNATMKYKKSQEK